ncbi:hypothetical protein NUBL21974_31460 [Klebsiella quasipneumoniae]|nr:hypothetical protein NUBL21974_31460 [Klebsiella quasipneumoniae]
MVNEIATGSVQPNAGATSRCSQRIKSEDAWSDIIMIPGRKMMRKYAKGIGRKKLSQITLYLLMSGEKFYF